MNLEQLKLNLSEKEYKHLENYFEKARTVEVNFCQDHDREFLQGEKCPICFEEEQFFLAEKGDSEAQRWVNWR